MTSQVEPKLLAIDQALLRLTTLVQEALASKDTPHHATPAPVSVTTSPQPLGPKQPSTVALTASSVREASPELEYYTAPLDSSIPPIQLQTPQHNVPPVPPRVENVDQPKAGQQFISILVSMLTPLTSSALSKRPNRSSDYQGH